MCITKVFMCHPLSTFTICIFCPLYFLHLNFVRSYCSWPPFHPLPFLNFHFIHEFQHELEATLSYQKTTMKSILKVLLHKQPLNLLISCFSDMTQLRHPFKCSMKLQINSKLPKKWTKPFSSKYSLSGGLNRINLLLQFLLMWLGLLCFPAWICIPWNFIKASATLKSKWKDLAFSNPQSTNYAAYNSSLHNSWWLRLGPPTKNKWYDLSYLDKSKHFTKENMNHVQDTWQTDLASFSFDDWRMWRAVTRNKMKPANPRWIEYTYEHNVWSTTNTWR